ncbi:arsenate reductase ArsC [bacterium]|nr:arsenate reductase ArsC [bacterium]
MWPTDLWGGSCTMSSSYARRTPIEAMRERGYDLSTHTSKGLADVQAGPFDYVITMGCGDACPSIPARHREDWRFPDPRDMPTEALRTVRDEIESRVIDLVSRLRDGDT